MNSTVKYPDFLAESITIGNEILSQANKTKDGWYWMMKSHKGLYENSYILYNGDSGTVYFLIELYKITKDEKILNAIVKSCEWFISNRHSYKNGSLAWYCGLGGVVYVLLETAKITEKTKYKKYAIEIVRNAERVNQSSAEILYGTAGTIITLIYLHTEINEEWVLKLLSENIDCLLESTIFTPNGICWDRLQTAVRPLCGFAHGVSGVAFVLLELYDYFDNGLFYEIAKMAFAYEDQYFANNNWPDFRKDIYEEDAKQKFIDYYKQNNLEEFYSTSSMSAWCHGAPGVGLTRLRACQADKEYPTQSLFSAISTTLESFKYDLRNYTFCHGVLGNATLLLEADKVFKKETYNIRIIKEVKKCLDEKKLNHYWTSGTSKGDEQADCDLLNGIAGIGLFLLQVNYPNKIQSPLYPSMTRRRTKQVQLDSINQGSILAICFKNLFPNMYIYNPQILFDQQKEDIKLNKFIQNDIINLAATIAKRTKDDLLNEAFELDLTKIQLTNRIWSDAYLYVKHLYHEKEINKLDLSELSLDSLFAMKLFLDSTVYLVKKQQNNINKYYVLQISSGQTPVEQYYVGEYTYVLLDLFNENRSLKIVYELMKQMNFHYLNSENSFDNVFKNQIINNLKMGFLTLSEDIIDYKSTLKTNIK